ncbi:transcriptional regulator, TetR family [Micromonospora pattaloongensis]|uniref:Transcriptional regulator, TetR family n=1 Tax=Micromonospora pattaloongensis TaxID=405436 RepID=A0A1H3T7P0_9ACTN|nr:transcriptional regulator, TetR family [Micromonospora pattaloongensis]
MRARTRQAILDAAITVLGQEPTVSLGAIAAAADVGRTTLHRYFPERSELLRAVNAEVTARLERAVGLARLDEGRGIDALRRLTREYFDLGDVLSLIFNQPHLTAEVGWADPGVCDPRFETMVRRGHEDGTLDPDLPPPWVHNLLWAQLYAAYGYLADSDTSRHTVLGLLVRTVTGAAGVKSARIEE